MMSDDEHSSPFSIFFVSFVSFVYFVVTLFHFEIFRKDHLSGTLP
jgi:hypothetical protein